MANSSPFWTFSLETYHRPGVPGACVTLQDRCGVDVNILLFCLFLAHSGRALNVADVAQMDGAMRDWRQLGVVKLREVRRFLKQPPEAFQGAQVEAFRDRIKAVELEAERLQQEALFALRPIDAWGEAWGEASSPEVDVAQANLSAYAQWLDVVFSPQELAPLLVPRQIESQLS